MSCSEEDLAREEEYKNENRTNILHRILNQGFIKILITIFCLCVAFLVFYIIFNIFKILYPHFVIIENPVFDRLLLVSSKVFDQLAKVSLVVGASLLAVFLVLYTISKIPFVGWLTSGIPPFPECNSSGLFGFFDDFFGALGFNLNKSMRKQSNITVKFLKGYFENIFGIITGSDGSDAFELNDTFLTTVSEIIFEKECVANMQYAMKESPNCKKTYQKAAQL